MAHREESGIADTEYRSTWESLYAKHRPAALRLAYLLTGSSAEAEDVAEEAFLRVFSRLRTPPREFEHYLRRVIVNVVRSRYRSRERERRRVNLVADRTPRHHEDPEPVDDRVWAALGQLSESQRAAVVLRYWLDLSEAETARLLRCRRGTAKSLVSRGLAGVREVLGDA